MELGMRLPRYISRTFKRAWIPSSKTLASKSQDRLLRKFLGSRFRVSQVGLSSGHKINTLFLGNDAHNQGETLVMAHGYGSGLGMFFENFDHLLESRDSQKTSTRRFNRIIAFDWLGMGLSDRPSQFPRRQAHASSKRKERTIDETIDFFINSFFEWAGEVGLLGEGQRFHLLGHSLGGYLTAQYALKYPETLASLSLVSPVGLTSAPKLHPPSSSSSFSSETPGSKAGLTSRCYLPTNLPLGLRLVDLAWRLNVTPQSIVRALGQKGPAFADRAVAARFGNRWDSQKNSIISEYLYHLQAQSASGEYALNSLLEPIFVPSSERAKEGDQGRKSGVYARKPIGAELAKLWLPGDKQKQRVDPEFRLNVLFGDRDWIWHDSVRDTMKNLDTLLGTGGFGDARSKLTIVPSSGHHLYLDNPSSFNQSILSVLSK